MGPLSFTVEHQSGQARVGRIVTAHSVIETPVFMPVGTNGVVKAMMAEQVASLGAQIILGNSYHLYLRPGLEVLREAGGLHRFAGWERSILTDSGGFQVFSLQKLSRLSEEGVAFQSHIDGSRHFFTPELVMEIQGVIGSDIAMVLDDCPALPATPERLAASVTRSLAWAERAIRCERPAHQALFGIVQGGLDLSLRLRHLEALAAMPFDGLAIGGLSVGEPPAEMHAMCRALAPQMPAERPRYLMGVGTPWDLVACAGAGVDMFDCVLPTRNARMGTVYTRDGERINIRNAVHRGAMAPLDSRCDCYACRHLSRAYLRHLFVAKEITGVVLLTLHNLSFYLWLMGEIRRAIRGGTLAELEARFAPQQREGEGQDG